MQDCQSQKSLVHTSEKQHLIEREKLKELLPKLMHGAKPMSAHTACDQHVAGERIRITTTSTAPPRHLLTQQKNGLLRVIMLHLTLLGNDQAHRQWLMNGEQFSQKGNLQKLSSYNSRLHSLAFLSQITHLGG